MTSRSVSLLAFAALALPALGCKDKGQVAALPEKAAVAAPASGAADPAASPASQPADPVAAAGDAPGELDIAAAPGSFSATTEPHRRSTLMPKVGGVVTRVYVREGDVVTKNQPLVALDTADYQLRLEQAEAGLEGARVELDATQVEYDRMKNLVASKAAPKSQLDGIDAKLRGAKVKVRAAQVGVNMARKAVADSIVRSPYAGLVVKRHVNEGEFATSMPPTPLITIDEVGILDVRVQIPASEIGRIHDGDPLIIRFPAIGKEIVAKVARVVPALNPGTRSFSAVVELVNPDPELKSGLFAEARRPGAAQPGKP